MKYTELRKLFYSDPKLYKEEYIKRFNGEDTVKLDFYIGENQAFFVPTKEVLLLAFKISKLDKEVLKLTNKLPNIAINQYFNKCLIDEAVVTNKIEGVHSSRKEIGEVLDMLERQSKGKNQLRFSGLVKKYMRLTSDRAIELNSCADIRNLYDELLLNEVKAENPENVPDGKIFRKEATSIYSNTGKELHMGLYPESKIIKAMENALCFLNKSDAEPIFKICIFHYLFEYIHPFYDGNGRLGRFILSWSISRTLEPILAYRISNTIKENIKQYYRAFEACNDIHNMGELTGFLIMMLNMIYEAISDLKDALDRREKCLERYENFINNLKNSDDNKIFNLYYILLQAALFSERGISSAELKNALDLKSYATLNKYLELIDEELLITRKINKANYYELNLKRIDKIILDNS